MENKLNRQGLLNYEKVFSDKVMSNFFQQNEKVTGKQLLEFTPIRQVNLMLVKNLYEKWQTETLRLQSPFFDYNDEGVKEALRNFMNILSQHISVTEADFRPLLEQSVHESLLLSLSPADFFESEVSLLGESKLTPIRVKELGKYIQLNKILLDTVLTEIESFHVKQVASGELIKALHKQAAAISDKLLTVPQVIEMFGVVATLSEQDLVAPLVSEPAVIAIPEPANFFENHFLTSQPEPVVAKPIIAQAPPVQQQQPQPVVVPPVVTAAPQKIADLTLSDDKSLLDTFVKDTSLNDTLKTQAEHNEVSSVLDKIQKQKVESLHAAFPIHERFMYVNDLFGGDYVAWSMALQEIDNAPSLAHANAVLQNLAQRFTWKANSERVRTFTDLVERRF